MNTALTASFRTGRRAVTFSFGFNCSTEDADVDELEDDPDVSLPESLESDSLSFLLVSFVAGVAGGCLRRRTIMVRFFLRVRVGDFLLPLLVLLGLLVFLDVETMAGRCSTSSRLIVGRAVGDEGPAPCLDGLDLAETGLRGLMGDVPIARPASLVPLGLAGVVTPPFFEAVRFRSVAGVPALVGDVLVGDLGGLRLGETVVPVAPLLLLDPLVVDTRRLVL